MTDDERAIRQLIDAWLTATKRGDLAAMLDLMTDDIVFLLPGQEPFGRKAFAEMFGGMRDAQIEGTSEIVELQILDDWAFIRNHVNMTFTPPNGNRIHRSGYTLTLLHKEDDGRWRIARDANLLT